MASAMQLCDELYALAQALKDAAAAAREAHVAQMAGAASVARLQQLEKAVAKIESLAQEAARRVDSTCQLVMPMAEAAYKAALASDAQACFHPPTGDGMVASILGATSFFNEPVKPGDPASLGEVKIRQFPRVPL